jgi:radical SAM protein with 4Fe4S-binding SPASM domain
LFTGGEVFLRRDFFEIYHHALQRGLLVTIFTNGTTVTEKIADRLSEQPPYNIEVTLYGYSKQTYEKVTGIPGSHAMCYRGVELLRERGLPLKLKTVLMRTNKDELMDMFHFAERLGLPFKYDTMINPHFDGSLTPCKTRLSPQEVVDLDFALPSRLEEYQNYFEPRKEFRSDRVFSCGAGSRTFHVDPYGNMMMCLLLREPAFSLREMSFQQIWNEKFPPIYGRMRSADHPCNTCNLSSLCEKCPAWSRMEKGDVEARVEYGCEVGHRRAERLGYYNGPVDQYTRTLETTSVNGSSNQILLPVLQDSGGGCR